MPERPHPDIWQRLRAVVEADPTPPAGEQRLIGAVQHAQAGRRVAVTVLRVAAAVLAIVATLAAWVLFGGMG